MIQFNSVTANNDQQALADHNENKIKVISIYSSEFEELCRRKEWIASDVKEFDPATMIESDLDILKMGKEKVYFFSSEDAGVQYVCHSADDDFGQINDILKAFLETKNVPKDRFTMVEGNWNTFNQMETGIAYRGGSGYVYTLWRVEEQKQTVSSKLLKDSKHNNCSSALDNLRKRYRDQPAQKSNEPQQVKIK